MIPTRIGQYVNGGYFAGFVRDEHIRSVIVSSVRYEHSRVRNTVPKTCFMVEKVNGLRATQILPDWFEDRNRVLSMTINGYCDWHIPSIAELTACFSNLSACKRFEELAESAYTVPKKISALPTSAFWFQTNTTETFKPSPYMSSSIIQPKQNVLSSIMFSNGHLIESEISSKWFVYIRPVRSEIVI